MQVINTGVRSLMTHVIYLWMCDEKDSHQQLENKTHLEIDEKVMHGKWIDGKKHNTWIPWQEWNHDHIRTCNETFSHVTSSHFSFIQHSSTFFLPISKAFLYLKKFKINMSWDNPHQCLSHQGQPDQHYISVSEEAHLLQILQFSCYNSMPIDPRFISSKYFDLLLFQL